MLTKDYIEYFNLFYKLLRENTFKDIAFINANRTDSLKNFMNTDDMLRYANVNDSYIIGMKINRNGGYIRQINLCDLAGFELFNKSVKFIFKDGTSTFIRWKSN